MLDKIRIAKPCPADWNSMQGDDRVRHCTRCDLNVYNFAAMSQGEIEELIQKTEGRLCARLYRRSDGTIITSDCPVGVKKLRCRLLLCGGPSIAAALLLALQLQAPKVNSADQGYVVQASDDSPASTSGQGPDSGGTYFPGTAPNSAAGYTGQTSGTTDNSKNTPQSSTNLPPQNQVAPAPVSSTTDASMPSANSNNETDKSPNASNSATSAADEKIEKQYRSAIAGLTDRFNCGEPEKTPDDQPSVITLNEHSFLQTDAPEKPTARLMEEGNRALSSNHPEEAEEKFKQALGLCEDDQVETDLVSIKLAQARLQSGSDSNAMKELQKLGERLTGNSRILLADALFQLGDRAYDDNQYVWAAKYFHSHVEIIRGIKQEHYQLPQALQFLGCSLYYARRIAMAESVFREALALNRQANPPSFTRTAMLLGNIAACLECSGKYEEAEKFYIQELEAAKDTDREVSACIHLCTFLSERGRYDEATKRLKESLPKLKQSNRFEYPEVLDHIAYNFFSSKKYGECALWYERAAEEWKKLNVESSERKSTLNAARASWASGNMNQARIQAARSLQMYEKEYGRNSTSTLLSRKLLAKSNLRLSDFHQAETLLQQNEKIADDAEWRADTKVWLGHCYRMQQKWQQAAQAYAEALQQYRSDNKSTKFEKKIADLQKFVDQNNAHDSKLVVEIFS